MDAGLAAVLGAAVGAIGSGTAAFMTGWWASRQTRWQLEGQQSLAREQVRFEHLKERREPRSQAYSDFITHIEKMSVGSHAALHALLADDESVVREFEDSLTEWRNQLNKLLSRVCLEGPQEIVHPATQAYRHVLDFSHRISLNSLYAQREGVDQTVARVGEQFNLITESVDIPLEIFIESARQVLDDHGTPSDH
jgi:hypothetical protein